MTQVAAFAVIVYITDPGLLLAFVIICGGIFPDPVCVFPVIPLGADEVQLNEVFATLELIETI